MGDFAKSGCCNCSSQKSCGSAFSEFAAELCPNSQKDKSIKNKK